jgi:hypothetical protein
MSVLPIFFCTRLVNREEEMAQTNIAEMVNWEEGLLRDLKRTPPKIVDLLLCLAEELKKQKSIIEKTKADKV